MRRARLRVELAESPPIAPEFPLHPDQLGQGMWAGSGTPLKDDPRGHSVDFLQERTLASASHRPEGVIGAVLMNGMHRSAQKKNRSHAISFSCTTAIRPPRKGNPMLPRTGRATQQSLYPWTGLGVAKVRATLSSVRWVFARISNRFSSAAVMKASR